MAPDSSNARPVASADRSPRDQGSWTLQSALATVTGNLFLVFGTIVVASMCLLTGWTPPRGNVTYWWARWWSLGLLVTAGVRLTASYEAELDPRGSYIFMANHQSIYDIPLLMRTMPGQARFLAKRSLFQIPIFGWAIKMGGFVSIDRRDLSRARGSFSQAVERLREGTSLLVFPEGTRSWEGELQPFKRGGFLLALKSGLPIVPVGIRGSLQVRPKKVHRISPGPVEVRFGRPIDVRSFGVSGRSALERQVRERIAGLAGLEEPGIGEGQELKPKAAENHGQ